MPVTVTNTTISDFNSDSAVTKNPATSTTADGTEVFTITPTAADHKVAIFIEVSDTDGGTVTWSIAAGDYWAAGDALTGSTAQGVTDVIVLEGAKYKQDDGTIAITFTPASGGSLLTTNALKVYVVELP